MTLRRVLPLVALLALGADGRATPTPSSAVGPGLTTLVGPVFLEPVLELPTEVATLLATGKHGEAAVALAAWPDSTVRGHVLADKKFLEAWSLVHSGNAAKAAVLLEAIAKAEHVPEPYKDLVIGEALLASGNAVGAATALGRVPTDSALWVRAQLALAEARHKAGATEEARVIWNALIERPDPATGSDVALLAMATRAGTGSPQSVVYLRRLFAHYPTTAAGISGAARLEALAAQDAKAAPSVEERILRAQRFMDASRWDDAIATAGSGLFEATKNDCRAHYIRGRSIHKQSRFTESIGVLMPVGKQCQGLDDDAGASSLYLAGKAYERLKQWDNAAAAYESIPALYPKHSMADDGYALGGVARQILGDNAKAKALWMHQVEAYPDGDLSGEAFFRLAWTSYLEGDTEGAIRWADRLVQTVPIGKAPTDHQAARYWSARWKLYPERDRPTALTQDPARKEQAVGELLGFVKAQPGCFYALLAAQRLYQVAPDRLTGFVSPYGPAADEAPSWLVRTEFVLDPRAVTGFALARLGLVPAAMSELNTFDLQSLTAPEAVLVTQIRSRGNALLGHDAFKTYLSTHPPSTLGPDEADALRYGYPELYWDLVKTATTGYAYDPRVFHGLVREESSFNPEIVSFAGARGLSQLMPATARAVAKQMGRSVTNAQLFDPETNLTIGSRYFDDLTRQYRGNVFLAVAGYNAGPGNVAKWLAESGERPTDEFVERIPIRETRHYVKRVLGTFQMYRVLYDTDQPVYPDWTAFMARAQPRDG